MNVARLTPNLTLCALCLVWASQARAAETKDGARLLTKADMQYAGALLLPKGKPVGGEKTDFAYSTGAIAYNPDRDSFYVASHNYQNAVAEVSNPGLVESLDRGKLRRGEFKQAFRPLLKGLPSGNPDKLTHLGGFYCEANQLVYTAYEFYDADNSAQDVFGVVRDASNLEKSKLAGFFETGHGAHTAGWVSPIPAEHQEALKGTHIMASGQSQSIAGRYPLRPAAFSFNGSDLFGSDEEQGKLKVTKLIDGNLKHLLPKEMWNHSLDEAAYGIIIPGTRTYVAFGDRGGMHSEVGYKITTYDGRKTGGYSAFDDDDHYMYYWMYDVDDMARAARGEISAYDVVPYEHGKLALPFLSPTNSGSIGSGTWDPKTGTVYLTLMNRDRTSQYTVYPLIIGLRFEPYAGQDEVAPYGAMCKPNGGATVKGATVKLEAHAIDNLDAEGQLTVQFLVDGEPVGEPATSFPFAIDWDSTTVANGERTISAIAADRAGNQRTLNKVTVTVGN